MTGAPRPERRKLLPKLACPFCGWTISTVVKLSRVHPSNRHVRRRRACQRCAEKFWTIESIDDKKLRHI